jgi:hypothetical protein
MAPMHPPEKIRAAKVFLASRITEEAERASMPLSEVERKMLYFSATGWTLDDLSRILEVFEETYDRRQYEQRIARFVRSARARAKASRDENEYETWKTALGILKDVHAKDEEEHYLLSLIANARPEGELTRIVFTAIVVIAVMLLAIYLMAKGY